MADLENLLLEAAGRTGGGASGRNRRPPSRRQREGSYSDDGTDSKDDESEDDDDHGYVSRKPSGSQIPIKKRLDPTERDDDRGSRGDDDDEEEDYEDGDDRRGGGDISDESDVGSDLYKDEYDREQLAQMTELEREMILSDRAQRRDDQRLTERVRAKQSGKKPQPVKETPPPSSSSSRVRSSARSAERAAAKDDALNELRAKRMKQQDPEGYRKSRDSAARGGSYGERDSPVRRKSIMAAASPSSESSGSESQSESHSRDEESAGNDELGESDEEKSPGKEALSLDNIKAITIRRSKLAKWLLEPFFEEVVVGCFVRLGIGKDRDDNSIYRLCKVLNVDASDPDKQYVLEGKSTHKYLHVIFGKSEARWQMDRVSNSPPLEKEFKEWVQQMEKMGGHMPSKNEVLEKQEAIQKAITYVYSAATVKQMLHEKKSASTRPLNVAAEKARLRRELEIAQSRRDGGPEVERIQARLQELENLSRDAKEKDAKAVRLEEMNKRNRAENFKNASELKPVNTSLKAGEAGYDPFSRRWTRSRNYYVSNSGGGDGDGDGDGAEAPANGDLASPLTGAGGRNAANASAISEDGVAATAAALEAAAGAGKLVDTSAPVDHVTESNSLHDFELSISLTELREFGGPQGAQLGFMARKQKIEATVGCRVPESDGRRHPLTLTVSDYKRRRGLL